MSVSYSGNSIEIGNIKPEIETREARRIWLVERQANA